MKIEILPDAGATAARAAALVADTVRANPRVVLGLATGGTMMPVYAELVRLHQAGTLSLAAVTSFNLDEYVGLSPDDPGSYHRVMAEALVSRTDLRAEAVHLPRGDAPAPEAEARAYEARVAAVGGIDLQLLGLGANGHIGFNEPGSPHASRTRVVELDEATRAANRRYFADGADVPRQAITMGIGTILEARACLLVATGPAKARAVAAMLEGRIGPPCPASALRTHPRVTVLLDRAAAAELSHPEAFETRIDDSAVA